MEIPFWNNIKDKEITRKAVCMATCSLGASALNLGTWFLGVLGLIIVLYNLLVYVIVGTPVYYLLRNVSWQLQTFAVWISVNAVSIAVLLYYFLEPSDEPGAHCVSPFVFLIPVVYVITGILSVIPIGYFCRKEALVSA